MHSLLTALLVVCAGVALASSAHAFAVDNVLFKRDPASSLSAMTSATESLSAASMVAPKSLRLGLPAAASSMDATKAASSTFSGGPGSLAATASAFIAAAPATSGASKSLLGGEDVINVLGTALGVGVLLWSSAQAAW
ncbi:hypothetical protein JCM11251_007090 [Rhodosporidiobolus azoricus]